jgi:ATP/maltotriose-dependent transcriptional regulator MalT/transcriptional regulator with XRE-family HTH domain
MKGEGEMETSFGSWIRRRRKALDLTQAELAQRVGCSTSTIIKIESEERRPSRQIAELLARHLEIPPDQHSIFIKVARQERGYSNLSAVPPLSEIGTSPAAYQLRSNLPFFPTPFVGRENEIDVVSRQLLDPACRLLTLTGPGGVGKTRLAVEVARKLEAVFKDGVFFLPMASVELPESIIPVLADVLRMVFSGPADPKLQVINLLNDKRILLVFDNMEHLVDGSDILGEILNYAKNVKLLLTSREQMHLQWEWIFDVQGLPVPIEASPIELDASSAVTLFLQRARQVSRNFRLSPEESTALVRVCKSVDGLPLAIELAASWVRIMSVNEIALELERNLDLLETSLRDIPARHRSIKMVFEHSWVLLTAEERLAMMRLSVFSGGFTRQAAHTVAGASIYLLSSLVSKSLLYYDSQEDRYDLHELIRLYANAQLRLHQTQPDLIPELHRRAAEWFERNSLMPEAIQHALAAADFNLAARIIEKIAPATIVSGKIRTALGWLDSLPNELMLNSPNLCLIHSAALMFTNQLEAAEARLQDSERYMDSQDVGETTGQGIIRGRLAIMRANLTRIYGDLEQCIAQANRSLELLPESESFWRASPLVHSASAYLLDGDVGVAREEQAAATVLVARDSGNLFTLLRSITNLARLQVIQGHLQKAARTYRKVMEEPPDGLQSLIGSASYYFGLAYYFGLGSLYYEWNDLKAAEGHLLQGIDLVRGTLTADADMIIFGYAFLARLRQARGDYAGALAVLGELAQLAQQRKFLPSLAARKSAEDARIRLAQGDLPAAVRWAESSGLSLKDQDLPFPKETEYLTLARVMLARGQENPHDGSLQDILDLLGRLHYAAESGRRMGSIIEILSLRALALYAMGDLETAGEEICRALHLAEPEGFTRVFVDHGEAMHRLFQEVSAGRQPAQARKCPWNELARVLTAFQANLLTK